MLIEALFWFYPLVWWIGARLIAERERACDEAVVAAGHSPRIYAEGILKVCRFYLKSSLACAAGVSGSNLKARIERIMTASTGSRLSLQKTVLIAAAAIAAVAAPLGAGLIDAMPAAARAAIFTGSDLKSAQAAQPPPEAPPALVDKTDAAPRSEPDAGRGGAMAQSLKRVAEIVAAPADMLIAASQIDPTAARRESLVAPDLQMAALMTQQSATASDGPGPSSSPAPLSGNCRLTTVATFRTNPRSYLPLLGGEINGHKVQLVAAVSSRTAVFRSAAKDIDVLVSAGRQNVVQTPGGPTELTPGWIRDLELDDMPREALSHYDVHEDFNVLVEDGGVPLNPSALLGARFWSLSDNDFDLASGSISLVRPVGCGHGETLPFNGGAYSQTPLLTPGDRSIEDIVTVVVDGVALRALIDTSASTTIMSRQGAYKLNHQWPPTGAEPQGEMAVKQPGNLPWWKARFKSFSLGEETIQNPRIAVADLYSCAQDTSVRWMDNSSHWRPDAYCRRLVNIPDMILGADFFHAHHVLISNSRRMLYFAYNGASMFH